MLLRPRFSKAAVLSALFVVVHGAVGAPAQEDIGEDAQSSAPTGSAVYRTRDAEGNIIFTDVMTEDAEEVELGETIIFSPEQIRAPDRAIDPRAIASESEDRPAFTYRTLAILEPAHEEVIRNNAGNFNVVGAFEPALRPDHRVELLIDGAVYATGQSTTFSLEHVDRGIHELQLRIVDSLSGDVIAASPPVTMSLLRFSVLHPGAKPPPPRGNPPKSN